MAYDQSNYQPPPRAYYGQQQRQQAPVQQPHRNEAQQGYDEFGQGYPEDYSQGYGNGYYGSAQHYEEEASLGNGNIYGRGQYDAGAQHQGGYQQNYDQEYGRGQDPTSRQNHQQRSYDPRYQQKAMGGGRGGSGQQDRQGRDPRQKPPGPQDRQVHQGQLAPRQRSRPPGDRPRQQQSYQVQSAQQGPTARQGSSNGYPRAGERRPRPEDPMRQRRPEQPVPLLSQDGGRSARDRPPRQALIPTPHDIPAPRGEQTNRMAEWKAKEKARMKAEAKSPEVSAQDNAFPVFFNPRPNPRNQNLNSTDASEDRARPSTSEGPRSRGATSSSQRPGTSGGGGAGQNIRNQPPIPDGNFGQTYDPSYGHMDNAVEPSQQIQWPIPDAVSQQQQYPGRNPSNSGQDPRQPYIGNAARSYSEETQKPNGQDANDGRFASQQPMQKQRRGVPPPIQSIQTSSQQHRHAMPAYASHQQPLSPAVVPSIPATAHDSKSNASYVGPASAYAPPLAETPEDYGYSGIAQAITSPGLYSPSDETVERPYNEQFQDYDVAPTPRTAQNSRRKHDTIMEVYAHYGGEDPPTPPGVPGQASAWPSREDEIEAEMPDFDSAAPGQTSSLHKRQQTVGKHLDNSGRSATVPPPMPQAPSQPSYRSAPSVPANRGQSASVPPSMPHTAPPPDPSQRPRFYQQQSEPQTIAAPRVDGISGGFVFGFSGEESTAGQYGQQMPPPQQEIPYRQGPPTGQPVQQYSTRPSLGDPKRPRQPSGSNGARPPVLDRNGQPLPVRGPYPPQGRPDIRPGQGAQPVWSDPGQQRKGSAVAQRPGVKPPPDNGGDLQQRHSNPDSLPQHPTPLSSGLGPTSPQNNAAHPAPVRNYGGGPVPPGSSGSRQGSVELPPQPVTHAELDQLRATVSANPENLAKSLLLVKKLVEASNVLASESGRLDARSTAKNRERYINDAHKRLKKLVGAAYSEAQFYLADCYGQGMLGLEVDTKEAFNLYQAAGKQNHAQAAYRTAVCCEIGPELGGGTRRDYAKAVQWYKRAATLGDQAAQFKTGMISLKGLLGAPRNVDEAIVMLKRAAEQADRENPHALHELAILHEPLNPDPEVRDRLPADEKLARHLFQQAADYGYKLSQFRLGQAHEYGSLGCKISHRNSIFWYTKAAAQGEHQAELALSGWYLTGAEGVLEHSDHEAYMWARKAALSEPPLAKAMFAMGYFTENGIGCPASLEEAKRWYGRAASYKFPKALERLEELKKGVGAKGKGAPPANGRLTRKDQRRDEAECVVM
ncbi:hypothetical protein MBLNU230_g3515t1 [Neophaeotheca triangularis]